MLISSSSISDDSFFYVQKRTVDGNKQGNTLKKLKKDKVSSASAKASRSENVTVSGAPRVKPELPLPVMYFLKYPCSVACSFSLLHRKKIVC